MLKATTLLPAAAIFLAALAHIGLAQESTSTTTPKVSTGKVTLSNTGFNLPPNTQWREVRIMSAPDLKLNVDLGTDKNVRGTMTMHSRQLLDVTVTTPTDLRLKFVQSNTSSNIDFGNNRNRQTTPLPLDGETVLAKRAPDGRWVATLEKRPRPTPEEARALYGLTYLWAEGIYPDKEIAIGESWKIDAKTFKNMFGTEFHRPRGEFEFTLARTVQHEGMECAKITGKGKITSQTRSLGPAADGTTASPLDATMDLTMEIYHSIALGIDIDVKMSGTLDLSNRQDKDALTYRASSPVEFTRTFRARK